MSQPGLDLLRWSLEPIGPMLQHEDTTEVVFMEPHVCGVEQAGRWHWHDLPAMNRDRLEAVAVLAARMTGKSISGQSESCASVLPGGERIKLLVPPAVPAGTVGICIRKRAISFTPTLEWLADTGYFEMLDQSRDWIGYWSEVASGDVPNRSVAFFSGGIGQSKTTVGEAVLRALPDSGGRRLVTVEGSPEWLLNRRNWQRLFFDEIDPESATRRVQDAMQLRPDALWLQEVRGSEGWALLRALKIGVPGGSTIHAPSARRAFDSLESAIRQSPEGRGMEPQEIRKQLRQYIHVVAHCARFLPKNDGERSRYRMTEVLEVGATPEEDRNL